MQRRSSRIATVTVLIMVLGILCGSAAYSADAIRLFMNGQELFSEVPPRVESGRTLVPVRAVVEALGAVLQWDGVTQTITIQGAHSVVMTVGSATAFVDGQERLLEVPPQIVDGRTLVPVRFVAEAFGLLVEWDGSLQAVKLTTPTPAPKVGLELLELVAAETHPAGVGTGNQARITRTGAGVFTTYLMPDTTYHVEWRSPGGWMTVAQGKGAEEAPQVLRGPDDGAYVVDWPFNAPRVSYTAPGKAQFTQGGPLLNRFTPVARPQAAAGISPGGEIVVSNALDAKGKGHFEWASYSTSTRQWSAIQKIEFAHRWEFIYVVPGADHSLTLVANRKAQWETLGYQRPAGAGDSLWNALRLWYSADTTTGSPSDTLIHEETPTAAYPFADTNNNWAGDTYTDNKGRLHVLYHVKGESTRGADGSRHAIIEDGRIVNDVEMPTGHWRMVQDSKGSIYYLDSRKYGVIKVYPATDADGLILGESTTLSLGDYGVGYPGLYLAVPRTGTAPADYVDGVFATGGEVPKWVYIRIRLR
ncbi:MAG TPA: copper amine oxidase N-terminal domain-containing protein [Symbiobacteriaceae bacterium]|nr:copper amine oxidase N-terminal domain-containing protein [Symbiobacteriaceae bacterium]